MLSRSFSFILRIVRRGDKQRSRERAATIYDVAEVAGVSTATVSNVLRGTKYVRPELHKRVQDAIAAVDYRPNRVAKRLRLRRTRTIGVVVPDITVGLFSAIVRRIEQRAAFTDYQIILADTREDISSERDRVRMLVQRQIDGLIVVPCADDSPVLAELRERGIPTVLLDRVGRDIDFDSVSADNLAASREGTQHLISLGHRDIILLASDLSLRNIRERVDGYRQALQQAGLSSFEQVLVVGRNAANTVSPVTHAALARGSEAHRPVCCHSVDGHRHTQDYLGMRIQAPGRHLAARFRRCRMVYGTQAFPLHNSPTGRGLRRPGMVDADGATEQRPLAKATCRSALQPRDSRIHRPPRTGAS